MHVRWKTNHASKDDGIETPFLSLTDIQMAQGCDEVAKEVGAKGQGEQVDQDSEGALRQVAQENMNIRVSEK